MQQISSAGNANGPSYIASCISLHVFPFTPGRRDHHRSSRTDRLAVGETVILLHPPLTLAGVSIGMERGCQQNGSLADGYDRRGRQARR